jgi:hypothetical protein
MHSKIIEKFEDQLDSNSCKHPQIVEDLAIAAGILLKKHMQGQGKHKAPDQSS